MNKLHVDSVTKSFGQRKILQDVYLSCETGRISALFGPSGSGKSTLMEIIFGTAKGDTQFIKFNDSILKNQSDRKNKLAYLPQRSSFLPKECKIQKLIPLFCTKENTEVLYSLKMIQPFLDKTVRNLSGGEKRIVETLIITHCDSAFILLDEPFSGVSPKSVDELKTIIKAQSKNKGIIISDHNYSIILDIADDIYLLSETYLRRIKDVKELQQFNYLPKS
ncbi:ATP-binding cassette domain-containing protein [Chryseobacterium shigense]|uniref:ABC-type lipopolysaccharide export system ATPase subunit n=1 Tax=Chryseobacterium shigense TaxID=297244 RepID=A0A841N2Q3_9FLAO|nr:ATP-binding cassette domain-containing protein [Chryseobacterium shigense]MBB6370717.1 ABC-type lipopolysaccharide export system ATPase subunit [Chryseobacterium shigense]